MKDNTRDMMNKGRSNFIHPRPGEAHHKAKLTDADVIEIRRLRQSGSKLIELSNRFGVSMTMISYIARRKNWTHIPDTDARNLT